MKIKSLFLAALLIVCAGVSFAGKEDPRTTGLAVVPVKGSEVFRVIYKGETAGKVRVKIFNAAGQSVLTETINNMDGFILPVNFSGLEFGDYTIELTSNSGKHIQKVAYQPATNISFVHLSKVEGTRYLLSIASKGAEVVTLNIYDADRNLVHNETTRIAGDHARVYRLSGTSSAYTFEVSDSKGFVRTVSF